MRVGRGVGERTNQCQKRCAYFHDMLMTALCPVLLYVSVGHSHSSRAQKAHLYARRRVRSLPRDVAEIDK